MPQAEAEIRARQEFGNVPMLEEDCRESKGLAWPDGVASDARFGFRMLRKNPAFALTAILTLGLCIGANTAIFSVVDAVLFKQAPYPSRTSLGGSLGWSTTRGENRKKHRWMERRGRSSTARCGQLDVAVFSGGSKGVNLALPGAGARYVLQQRVSAGFFRVLGVAPMIGREIQPRRGSHRRPRPWQCCRGMRFGNRPALPPRKAKSCREGEPYTVVGVMPEGFRSPCLRRTLWTPLRPLDRRAKAAENGYGMLARIRSGYTWKQANAELSSTVTPLLDKAARNPGTSQRLHLISLQRAQGDEIRTPLLLLWAAAGMVLLIGCVNVAGLLLARGGSRRHEIATRLALGSARSRILRQLLTESLLIAIAGGVSGLALGYGALEALKQIAVHPLGANAAGFDRPSSAYAITLAMALLTSILFGLFPALSLTRMDIRTVPASLSSGASGFVPHRLVAWG